MKWGSLFLLLFVYIITIPGKLLAQDEEALPYLTYYSSQLWFEENKGQFDPAIRFQTEATNRQIRFLETSVSFAEIRQMAGGISMNKLTQEKKFENYAWQDELDPEHEALVWNINFLGISPDVELSPKFLSTEKRHYLKGNKSQSWARGVQRYKELWYENIYEDIDLRYYGSADHQLKYDFILQPQAEISQISMGMEGVYEYWINAAGELVVLTEWGEIADAAPYSYQYIHGEKVTVSVVYCEKENGIGFQVMGAYDATKPLVIDPITMNWSSFLHSGVSDDYIMAVMRDASDFVYTVGYTKAMTFPLTPGVYQNIYGGGIDAFVTKLDPSGTSLIYSTFIGGTSWEMPYGMDLVNDSEVILAGFALSSDYPTSATAYQTTNAGGLIDGFISRLSANGDSLVFSTYFGGSDRDYLYDMQADASGNVYVTGYTLSTDMPTSPTAYSTGAGGAGDIFVAKFSPDGSSLQYATFLGGNSYDIGNAIRVNANGEAFVAGTSGSANFPTTANAYQSNLINGGSVNEDGVFAKVSADGSSLVYSSYIGGNSSDGIYGLDLEGNDVVYLTGTTYSTNFPTSSAAYQFGNAPALGNGDAFVTKFDVSGNSLVYSTYVGGSDLDFPKSLRVNNNGEAVILGATRSANWPISPTSAGFSALYDLFVIQLSDDGSALLQSDLYGGSYNDYPRTAGSLFLSGNELTLGTTVHSPNMPSAGSGYQATKTNGVADAPWMVGLHINTVLPAQDLSWSAHWQTRNQWVQLAWEDQAPQAGTTYEIEVQRPGEDWTQLHSRLSLTQDPLFTLNDPDAALWRDTYVSYRIRLTRPNGEVQLTDLQEVRIPRFGGISLQAFPIPAQDWMTVRVQAESPQPVYLRLVDLKGRTVWKQTYAIPADEVFLVEEKISLEEMSAGLYLLHAQVNGASQIQKILIQ